MSFLQIDARGCPCPEPVIKTKRALEQGAGTIEILVDNSIAVQNIKRFAAGQNVGFSSEAAGNDFKITISR